MKILIVSGFFYPTNAPRAFRTTELVKEFVRMGHEVTLYSPQQNFDYKPFYKKYPFRHIQYPEPLDNLSGSPMKLIHFLGRIFVYQLAYPQIKLLRILPPLLQQEDYYDLLITIAVPHQIHWSVGNLYRKGVRLAKTWVADCGDPYMLAKSTNRKKPLYFKWIEKRWCSLCDYITVPTKGSLNGYYHEFHNKIRVIPQAFNFEEIILDGYVKHAIPTFAFSGGIMAGKRDIRPFLDKLEELNLQYKLYVYTHDAHFFSDYPLLVGKKIILSDFIPRLELLKKLSTMDFLLNLENGTAVQTPSKLIDYSLTKRPILSIDSNNIDVEKIKEFFCGDYRHARKIDNIGQYNIKVVAKQFLDLCKK